MIWSLQTTPDFTDIQFDQWSKLLEDRAGIYLGSQQRVFLQTQVTMRMRELGHSDYSQYYNRLVDGVAGKVEWCILVDRLVVKETSFFRHQPSANFVRDYLREKICNNSLENSFELWSVGCSSGEEPYSLAILMREAFADTRQIPYYGIIASDISRAALAIAKSGLYSKRKIERLDEHCRRTYFKDLGDGRYEVVPEIKERICFNHANVLNIDELPSIKLDVIYCQNMLIYFRRWLRYQVLDAFVERLKPGGVLVIGLGEVFDWTSRHVERIAADNLQVYMRKSNRDVAPEGTQ